MQRGEEVTDKIFQQRGEEVTDKIIRRWGKTTPDEAVTDKIIRRWTTHVDKSQEEPAAEPSPSTPPQERHSKVDTYRGRQDQVYPEFIYERIYSTARSPSTPPPERHAPRPPSTPPPAPSTPPPAQTTSWSGPSASRPDAPPGLAGARMRGQQLGPIRPAPGPAGYTSTALRMHPSTPPAPQPTASGGASPPTASADYGSRAPPQPFPDVVLIMRMEKMFNKLGGARMPIGDYLERFGCPSVENPFGDRVFAGMAKMHMMDDSKHGGGWYPIQDYAWFTAPEPFSKNNAQLPALRDAPAPTSCTSGASTSDWFSPAGAPLAIDWFVRYPALIIVGAGGIDIVYIRCLAIIILRSKAWLSHTSRLSAPVY
jgi:hypothetical protein